MKALLTAASFACALAAALAAGAAEAETPAQMAANKALVLEFYRQVFEPQDVSRAKDFMAPDMIEHNPAAGQGLAGFVSGFGARWTPRAVEARLRNPPAVMLADGPFVQLVFRRPRPDPSSPADPAKTYDSFWFDLFKIEGGKVVEHWDGALKPPVKAP